jgi:hypothetical protein
MATGSLGHKEVKSIEDQLEHSPVQATSALYGGSHDNPKAVHHSPKHKSGAGGTLTNSESGFGEKGKSVRRNRASKA